MLTTVMTVTSAADNTNVDGVITFREAVEAANTDAPVGDAPAGDGADRIEFNSSLSGQTIALLAGQLEITDQLEIVGLGQQQLTVDGAEQSRVFSVADGVMAAISDLTISGGFAGDGGGILNLGSLSLTRCTVNGNTASDEPGQQNPGDGRGGGIFNEGALELINSSVSGNSAETGGGGIGNNFGSVSLSGSTVSGNTNSSDPWGGGGGIANWGGMTSLDDSVIADNSSGTDGGGIYNSGTLMATDTIVSGNSAYGFPLFGEGGGIYNDYSMTLVRTTLTENTSVTDAGAILNNGSLTIVSSTVADNWAGAVGAGIKVNSGTLDVINTVISGNAAETDGGGIYSDGYGTILVSNSTIAGNSAIEGGGISVSGSASATVHNSIVALNRAIEPGKENISGSLEPESTANLLDTDPGFVTPPGPGDDGVWDTADDVGGNFRLAAGSPAIDAGDNAQVPADEQDLDSDGNTTELLPSDRRGDARLFDGDHNGTATVDIGAYEFSEQPPDGSAGITAIVVKTPTTPDNATTGEVASLPDGEPWIDEWQSFYVELWVTTYGTDTLGFVSAEVDLSYDTNYFTATDIQYGAGFSASQTGTLDDTAGLVDDVGAETASGGVGDDAHALLARVRFEPTSADAGVDVDPAGSYATAADMGLTLSEGAAVLTGPVTPPLVLNDAATELWPVLYDLDDTGNVSFGDFAYFADAFLANVGDPSEPFATANDFDHDGAVDFGDFAFFAANFLRAKGDGQERTYADTFPEAWGSAAVSGDMADALATFSLSADQQDFVPLLADMPGLSVPNSPPPAENASIEDEAALTADSNTKSIAVSTVRDSSKTAGSESTQPMHTTDSVDEVYLAWRATAWESAVVLARSLSDAEANDAGMRSGDPELNLAMYDAVFGQLGSQ